MPKYNPKAIASMLGVAFLAVDATGYGYRYVFIPYGFRINKHGEVKLKVWWQHYPIMHRGSESAWTDIETTMSKYTFEVLDADYQPTGAILPSD